MRQLSVPGRPGRRTAAWIAASLALAASAGCMSVGDDDKGDAKPAPSTSVDQGGTAAEPDGGHGAPGGRRVYTDHEHGGKSEKDEVAEEEEAQGEREATVSPSPSGPEPSPPSEPGSGGEPPVPPKGEPSPTEGDDGGSTPSPPPSQPPSEPAEPPSEPSPGPSPEPTDEPTASSAPEVHAGAMHPVDERGEGMRGEPEASPQPGPA
ncbi:hypothetical protein [Streptomyces sp. MUM 178J]|uniref:hypothetical protein n=1 Tax=Streptomyces sp. MUM 178J TaxID=2791991 RepID=UPI001F047F1C|nr:hypothetical protein [Streptomyces sp. MUM 178J]WRQ83067.1 hypothetical protein I3F59_029050 [Streptomyces sp. MUM 178J]